MTKIFAIFLCPLESSYSDLMFITVILAYIRPTDMLRYRSPRIRGPGLLVPTRSSSAQGFICIAVAYVKYFE